ncbi:MAG: phytanoyl-CoA dioxygenase family protein [Chloroflexota bacterium]
MSDNTIKQPTEIDDYLFDLRGYLKLENVLSSEQVAELNAGIDALLPLEPGEWKDNIQRHDNGKGPQTHLQNINEAGPLFADLIDYQKWIGYVNRYVGGDDGLFIDESFAILQRPGVGQMFHSGGHKRKIRTQFRFHNNEFRCGQVNVLIALTDIGPGDGPTIIIPGSHKSNLMHPVYKLQDRKLGDVEVEGSEDVFYKAGDALLFVDCLSHAGGPRINPGERRVLVYRYGPHWGHNRYGYIPSDEFLARITPAQRKIVYPLPPRVPSKN